MLHDAGPPPDFSATGRFPFLTVDGHGVYEIPVGPVHAGLIEPGHFRFSVVGESVLRLKARLWFVHRGIERLFEGRTPAGAVELAERISGDTSAAHSLAYCLAVEDAFGVDLPEPAYTGCEPCWLNSNASTTMPPTSAHWPTTSASPWPTRTHFTSANDCCGSTNASPATGYCVVPSSREVLCCKSFPARPSCRR